MNTIYPKELREAICKLVMEGTSCAVVWFAERDIVDIYGVPSFFDDLEKQLEEEGEDFWEADHRQLILFKVDGFTPGETQYGTGYGDVLHIPGYFEFEIVGEWDLLIIDDDGT